MSTPSTEPLVRPSKLPVVSLFLILSRFQSELRLQQPPCFELHELRGCSGPIQLLVPEALLPGPEDQAVRAGELSDFDRR
jgi:hypothetical protein